MYQEFSTNYYHIKKTIQFKVLNVFQLSCNQYKDQSYIHDISSLQLLLNQIEGKYLTDNEDYRISNLYLLDDPAFFLEHNHGSNQFHNHLDLQSHIKL